MTAELTDITYINDKGDILLGYFFATWKGFTILGYLKTQHALWLLGLQPPPPFNSPGTQRNIMKSLKVLQRTCNTVKYFGEIFLKKQVKLKRHIRSTALKKQIEKNISKC